MQKTLSSSRMFDKANLARVRDLLFTVLHRTFSFCRYLFAAAEYGSQVLTPPIEISQYFGNTSTKNGISHYFQRNIVPNAKAFLEARKQGEDTTNVIMVENVRDGKPGKG